MGVLAGQASLAALSLFLAWVLRRSSALTPLVAVAGAMVFFTLAGCLGALYIAGWVWYALCAAGLIAVFIAERGRIGRLITPGFLFFAAAGIVAVCLFAFSRPMLTHWDEFTFWGTAAKATGSANELYTTAASNLIARSYPPGLIVYSYMMQFFGGFTEHGLLACFAVLYMAAFAAAGALWGKNRTATLLFMAALVLLPFFFEINWPAGQMLWAYALCMADLPLAALFGGALCLYYAGGGKGGRLMLPFGVVLAGLVCVKDMGLALAAIALGVAALDMLFIERRRIALHRLRGWAALGVWLLYCTALAAGIYLLWAWHLNGIDVNRFEVGTNFMPMDMWQMLATGFAMLAGIGRSEAFSAVAESMLKALWQKPVCLLGPGVAVLAVILLLALFAFVFSATRRGRLRVILFTLAMAMGFSAFYIFNIFTYTFVFRPSEGLQLKDYARYIMPYWFGWLMASLTLFSRAATAPKATFYRLRVARAGAMAACAALAAVTLARGNWQGNFLRISPTLYSARQSVQTVVSEARAEGMAPDDVVYILSQGDDGSRFYMFGFEMDAVRGFVYSGDLLNFDGTPVLDEAGYPMMSGNVASTLIPPGGEHINPTCFECTRETLESYLLLGGFTHLLVDVPDAYVLDEFGALFSDGMAGWNPDDPTVRGRRYYRIAAHGGGLTLHPAGEGGSL